MKKHVLLFGLMLLLSLSSVFAQNGDRQQMSSEDRVKAAIEKMAPLNLSVEVKVKTNTILLDYYQAQQKAREEMRASGNMDRDAMMAKRKEFSDARDAKLKIIFTQDQMQQWKDVIEPSLRPQRGGGQKSNG
ncbi:MAG: hypothetical protein ABIT96_03465 [Ferruginibacter sp.]